MSFFPQQSMVVLRARKPNSTKPRNEQFCISVLRTYVFVMTICASGLFSATADAAPLNLFRLNPNNLAAGPAPATSGPSATTTDDATDGWNLPECVGPMDPWRHLRLIVRVINGQWGIGLTDWVSEEEHASRLTSCDDFARGVWPGSSGGSGMGGGFGGGAGSFGAPPVGGLGLQGDTPGFLSVVPSDDQTAGDTDGPGDDPPVGTAGADFDRVTLFALFDGPPSPLVSGPEDEDTPTPTNVTSPPGFGPESRPSPVPEPGSIVLLGSGLIAAWRARRPR